MSKSNVWSSLAVFLCVAAVGVSSSQRAYGAEKLSKMDKEYLNQVTTEVLGEKEAGQLARDKAKHEGVKKYAAQQVKIAEQMEKELHDLADRMDHKLPNTDELNNALQKRMAHIKSTDKFDKDFVAEEIHDHENMIDLLDKASEKADHKDLKVWFKNNKQTKTDELTALKDLQSKLDK